MLLKVAKRGTSAGWLARGVGGARAGICGCGCLAGGHAMDLQVANARFRVTASSKCATQADVRCWRGDGRPTLAQQDCFSSKSRRMKKPISVEASRLPEIARLVDAGVTWRQPCPTSTRGAGISRAWARRRLASAETVRRAHLLVSVRIPRLQKPQEWGVAATKHSPSPWPSSKGPTRTATEL